MKLSSHLSRITRPGQAFIPQIDGLRFVALLAVLAFHVWAIGTYHLGRPGDSVNVVDWVMQAGADGVELFFVISGFILALPFAQHHLAGAKAVRLGDYYWRRVTRIEPPYLIHLALVFVYAALVLQHSPAHQQLYGQTGWLAYTLPHLLASLVYAHVFIFQVHPYPNIVLWSLETEVQFYLLAPLLAGLFAIRPAWFRRGLMAVLVLGWPQFLTALRLDPLAARIGLLGSLPYFLAGFLLVEFYLSGRQVAAGKGLLWDLGFLLAGPAWVGVTRGLLPDRLLPWIFLLLCLAGFQGRLAAWFLSRPWVATIGGMCYTIYMYHWLLISVLIRGTIHLRTGILWLDLLGQFLVLTPVLIAVCAVPFLLFERPFMNRGWPVRLGQAWRRIRTPDSIPAPPPGPSGDTSRSGG